jgi:Spy/CpxP family protein refolding chaperone
MKKLLYIFLPVIALSMIAANGCSAKTGGDDERPSIQQQYMKGGPGNMRDRGDSGGKGGAKLGIPHGRWWQRSGVQEKLKLSSEQTAKLEKISLEGRKTMIKQRAELEILELELEPLMEAKTFDREKVEGVLGKMEGIRTEMAKERTKTLLDMREVLTSEQFKQLKEIKGKRGDHKKSGHGRVHKGNQRQARR